MVRRVNDRMVCGDKGGFQKFGLVVGQCKHSGLNMLTAPQTLTYLGIDLCLVDKDIRMSQKEYDGLKLHETQLADILIDGVLMINAESRRALTKQVIGGLLWITQTRPDFNHSIARLASSAVAELDSIVEFRKRVEDSNKIIKTSRADDIYVNMRSPLNWIPSTSTEAVTSIQLYCYSDGSFASLPGNSSMSSYALVSGKVRSLDGDFFAHGILVGIGSKKCTVSVAEV